MYNASSDRVLST